MLTFTEISCAPPRSEGNVRRAPKISTDLDPPGVPKVHTQDLLDPIPTPPPTIVAAGPGHVLMIRLRSVPGIPHHVP